MVQVCSGPKLAPNGDSFWVRRLFNVCVRFSVPQMLQFYLFTYPPRSKWASSEKMIFFWPKSSSSVSRSQYLVLSASAFQCMRAGFLCPKWDNFVCLHTRRENALHLKRWFFFCQNRNVAIFPSVVQAYTQPFSFGGRRKLIICQIRYDLSVTIYEISTSWKKR